MRKQKTKPLMDRIQSKLKAASGGCIIFTGHLNNCGYGRIWNNETKRLVLVHRAVYENTFGPIPSGLECNHICRQPSCINISHLELVSHRQNVLMGIGPSANNYRKKFCKSGHKLTPSNVYHPPKRPKERSCRICHALGNIKYRVRKRAIKCNQSS